MLILLTFVAVIGIFGIASTALAHCPLCTAGAGLAAIGASWLGIGTAPVGVFVGAFSIALGLWIARALPKRYVSYQRTVLVALSFVTTVFPLIPILREYIPIYISVAGGYGTLLNRTYLIPAILAGAIVGGGLTLAAPHVSRWLTSVRNGRAFPYQGVAITFTLLFVAGALFELWL